LAHMYSSSTFQGSGKRRLLRLTWNSKKQLKHAQARSNQSTNCKLWPVIMTVIKEIS
jgi:hypothetical protein